MMMTTSFTLAFAAFGMAFFTLMLAVVSASEQVFLSLTEAQLRRLKARGDVRASRVMEFVRTPHRVIRTTSLSSGVFFAGGILCLLLLIGRGEAVTPRHIIGPGLAGGLLLAVLGRSLPRALASARPATVAFHLVQV
ncbi:CNNM domain-containing protein, partial [bacterium]|nr:CNNM domain-containing protein [bacterium]